MIELNPQSKFNNNQGVILLIALMILTVMLVSVLALTKVIVGEVKMTRNTDNSIAAFYATESGIEKVMYYLKWARQEQFGGFTFDDFTELDEEVIDLGNGMSFVINQASTTDETFVLGKISTSTSAYIDLIPPAAQLDVVQGWYNCYKVDWEIENCWTDHINDRLEISYTSLGQWFDTSTTTKHTAFCNCGADTNDQCQQISSGAINNNYYYRFSFRPLDGSVASTTFRAYTAVANCGDGDSSVPSKATIKVTGSYRRSTYSITARLPIYSPISDVFSYILFSEEAIRKGDFE